MRRVIQEHLDEIRSALRPYENIDDVEVMLEELVRVRSAIMNRAQEFRDEEMLLSLLCLITYPGKPPAYAEPATIFRESLMGIRFDQGKRDWFREIVFDAVNVGAGEAVDFGNVASVLGRAVTMNVSRVSAELY